MIAAYDFLDLVWSTATVINQDSLAFAESAHWRLFIYDRLSKGWDSGDGC
jgi:hypothetical protein